MAIQLQGNSGTIGEVEASYRAMRMTPRPLDAGLLGHYRISTTISLLASQANGTLFSFRWADPTRICVLRLIRIECIQTASATATIMPSFQAAIVRGFTVADSGGQQIVTTGNNMKKRTSFGTSLVADIRKSTVASGLTVGTRTPDSDNILELLTSQTASTPNTTSYRKDTDLARAGDHPFVLAANEGFIIRGPTIPFGVAGTASLSVDLDWVEVAAY